MLTFWMVAATPASPVFRRGDAGVAATGKRSVAKDWVVSINRVTFELTFNAQLLTFNFQSKKRVPLPLNLRPIAVCTIHPTQETGNLSNHNGQKGRSKRGSDPLFVRISSRDGGSHLPKKNAEL